MDVILQKTLLGLMIFPIIMLITSFITWKFPPRKINPIYGFRTKRASKSQESWDYANKLANKLVFIIGIIGLLWSIAMFLIVLNSPLDIRYSMYRNVVFISAGVHSLLLLSIIFIVQLKLKRKGF